jgi:UDP-3-O-[3-hydroxymyristoyl] glucosamine N-acyltransferase
MSKIYILGNGGFAQEVFAQIVIPHAYDFGGFIILKNDEAFLIDDDGINKFLYPEEAKFILGTGNKNWRRQFINHFLSKYSKSIKHFPNVEAKTAFIASTSKMGIGNVFCENSLLNATAEIGDFNMLNPYASIFHDSIVGDNNVLSPYAGIMGYCEIGDENFLGVGTHIVPKVEVGNENTLSAGETLFDDMGNRQFFQSGIVVNKE